METGADQIRTGGGADTVSYAERVADVTVDLTDGTDVSGNAEDGTAGNRDLLDDVENAAKLIAAFAQKLSADLDFKR